MRSQLLQFVDEQRVTRQVDGSYDVTACDGFAFKALGGELQVREGDRFWGEGDGEREKEIGEGRRRR